MSSIVFFIDSSQSVVFEGGLVSRVGLSGTV